MRLAEMRTKAGISQKEIAEALGVGQNTVSQWESNHRSPSIKLLPKLAAILGCTIEELLKEGGEQNVL